MAHPQQSQRIVVEAISPDRTRRHRIIADGIGTGWKLAPPGHVNLTYFYEVTDRPSGRGRWPFAPGAIAPIGDALTEPEVPVPVVDAARALIDKQRLLYSEKWVQHVYAYYRRCYYPGGKIDPTEADWHETGEPEHHGGYLHVAELFPGHTPRVDLIERGPGYIAPPCRGCGSKLTYRPHINGYTIPGAAHRECWAGGVHDPNL